MLKITLAQDIDLYFS